MRWTFLLNLILHRREGEIDKRNKRDCDRRNWECVTPHVVNAIC